MGNFPDPEKLCLEGEHQATHALCGAGSSSLDINIQVLNSTHAAWAVVHIKNRGDNNEMGMMRGSQRSRRTDKQAFEEFQ